MRRQAEPAAAPRSAVPGCHILTAPSCFWAAAVAAPAAAGSPRNAELQPVACCPLRQPLMLLLWGITRQAGCTADSRHSSGEQTTPPRRTMCLRPLLVQRVDNLGGSSGLQKEAEMRHADMSIPL